jgi:DNA-binding NarL/FixJ family response regulator
MIRTILFEDNKNMRESLSLYLASSDELWFAGAFPDARNAIAEVKKSKPDVILMDIQMPRVSGIEATIEIKKLFPNVKILIQTVYEDDDKVFQALCAGANGYIVKSTKPERFVEAINDVFAGGTPLSPMIATKVLAKFQDQNIKAQPTYIALTKREKEVLTCMAISGMSYKMIADACGIKFSTVCTHLKNIYEKLHVNSAPEAVAKALKMNLI